MSAACDTASADTDLGFSSNQEALAEAMARHFGQRFGWIVSSNRISQFLRGIGIPEGAGFPPTKIKGRFDNTRWAAWMSEAFGHGTNGTTNGSVDPTLADHHRRKTDATLAKEEFTARFAQLKFEKANGQLVSAESARTTRRSILRIALRKIQRGHENEDTKKRADWLVSKLSPEDFEAWREFDLKIERARIDAIHADFANHIEADPEKELAEQESEK